LGGQQTRRSGQKGAVPLRRKVGNDKHAARNPGQKKKGLSVAKGINSLAGPWFHNKRKASRKKERSQQSKDRKEAMRKHTEKTGSEVKLQFSTDRKSISREQGIEKKKKLHQ